MVTNNSGTVDLALGCRERVEDLQTSLSGEPVGNLVRLGLGAS